MGIRGRGVDSDTYMWYCEACGKSFPCSDILTDYYPATRYEPAEISHICPMCGADDSMEEAPYECSCCGESYPGHKMSEIEDLCRACYDAAVQRLNKHIEQLEDGAELKVWRDMQEVYSGG